MATHREHHITSCPPWPRQKAVTLVDSENNPMPDSSWGLENIAVAITVSNQVMDAATAIAASRLHLQHRSQNMIAPPVDTDSSSRGQAHFFPSHMMADRRSGVEYCKESRAAGGCFDSCRLHLRHPPFFAVQASTVHTVVVPSCVVLFLATVATCSPSAGPVRSHLPTWVLVSP